MRYIPLLALLFACSSSDAQPPANNPDVNIPDASKDSAPLLDALGDTTEADVDAEVPCDTAVHKNACEGDWLIVCDPVTDYTKRHECPSTQVCMTSNLGWSECVDPGTKLCHPAKFSWSCVGNSVHGCSPEGFEYLTDCTATGEVCKTTSPGVAICD